MAYSVFLAALLASGMGIAEGYAIAQPTTKPSTSTLPFPDVDNTVPSEVFERIRSNSVARAFLRNKNQPFGVAEREQPTEKPSSPPRSAYDLGLGKNQPVVQKTSQATIHDIDMAEALQYWTEYESVNEFPSPLNQEEVSYETTQTPSKTTKRKIMPINPARLVEESLPILPTQSDAPVMFQSDSSQLDVNTAWVEMLIHSEQQKFALATAN